MDDTRLGAPALIRLYDKAKRAQWNAATDIDWSIDVDPLRTKDDRVGMLQHEAGSPFSRLTRVEIARLTFESQVWTVSQFLHGEQGALLATAKIAADRVAGVVAHAG